MPVALGKSVSFLNVPVHHKKKVSRLESLFAFDFSFKCYLDPREPWSILQHFICLWMGKLGSLNVRCGRKLTSHLVLSLILQRRKPGAYRV